MWLCPKCKKSTRPNRHHCFPRRIYGRGSANNVIFLLCRSCHNDLENEIPFYRMPEQFYTEVICCFIEGLPEEWRSGVPTPKTTARGKRFCERHGRKGKKRRKHINRKRHYRRYRRWRY